jgi:hypothetical protein
MKRNKVDMEDELRSEYDLKSLQVRKLGAGRKGFGGTVVRLEPDVAQMFPDAHAVNEALRLLLRVMNSNQAVITQVQTQAGLEPIDEKF